MNGYIEEKKQHRNSGPLTRTFLRWFRHVRRLERQVERLEADNAKLRQEAIEGRLPYPPGHFYSPIPSRAEIEDGFRRTCFDREEYPGVRLGEAEQFELLKKFAGWKDEIPLPLQPTPGWRYYLENDSYPTLDGVMLYSMLRHIRPRRIIEVGSGFSSAAMLDMNERIFDGRLELTFIDPDMGRLKRLLRRDDRGEVRLLEQRVQDLPLEEFDQLEPGDVLFIDSSHVAKIGSDVNHLYFKVIPRLKAGVYIHIHDIADHFEYPRQWYEEGRAWNEVFLLRAFLMYNDAFEVVLFAPWIVNLNLPWVHEHFPLCARGGGGQIWLRRIADKAAPAAK